MPDLTLHPGPESSKRMLEVILQRYGQLVLFFDRLQERPDIPRLGMIISVDPSDPLLDGNLCDVLIFPNSWIEGERQKPIEVSVPILLPTEEPPLTAQKWALLLPRNQIERKRISKNLEGR